MNKITKFATIVLALVVSFVANVKAEEPTSWVGKFTEPTGGKAEIRVADVKKPNDLVFVLLNGDTPGSWKCEVKGDDIIFLEGPFKDQVYKKSKNAAGKNQMQEVGGRKTLWTEE